MNMAYVLNYSEFSLAFYEHNEISNEILESLMSKFNNEIYKILELAYNSNNFESFTLDENKEYCNNFINKINELFTLNLSNMEKEFYLAYLVFNTLNADNEGYFDICYNMIQNEVSDESSVLWLIREELRYRLLATLHLLSVGDNIEKMKTLISLVKPNKEKFENMLAEFQKN